jgi:glyceraldehyde-3-phosphate dehydrogenase/erythrose-4-phosphate dehydrogenase
LAVRVPLLNASLTDFVFEPQRKTTVEDVNAQSRVGRRRFQMTPRKARTERTGLVHQRESGYWSDYVYPLEHQLHMSMPEFVRAFRVFRG